MRRVLAVVGAVMIVALAVVVRSALDDNADDGASSTTEPLVVACDPDLRAACEALEGVEVRIEDSAVTAAGLPGGEIDAWLTSSAWLEVAVSRTPDAIGEAETLARSSIVVAAPEGRGPVLEAGCADESIIRCVTSASEQPWSTLGGEASWGPVTLGLPPPDRATGLAVLAAAVGEHQGDLEFARNDLEGDPAFSSWLRTTYAQETSASPVRTMVTQRGRYSATVDSAERSERDRGQREVDMLDDASRLGITASAVFMMLIEERAVPDLGPARTALAEAGWQPASGEPGTMLKPGVMAALHSLWTEITR